MRIVPALLVSLFACSTSTGSGTDPSSADGGPDPGSDGGNSQTGDGGPDPSKLAPAVVFVFDRDADALFRLEDKNGDDDMQDAGELTRFFDEDVEGSGAGNVLGTVVLDESRVLIANYPIGDQVGDPQLVLLEDKNGDGDALDAGESSIWFDGTLPGGSSLLMPAAISSAGAGSVYLIDNNALGYEDNYPQPFAIYELMDADGSGAIEAGEIELVVEISPASTDPGLLVVGDVASVGGGPVYFDSQVSSQAGLYRNPEEVFLDREMMMAGGYGYTFGSLSQNRMAAGPDSDEIVLPLFNSDAPILVAVEDEDASGEIEAAAELRPVWNDAIDSSDVELSAIADLSVLGDGSVLAASDGDNARLLRFWDRNRDGDFFDADEVMVLYDSAEAETSEALSERLWATAGAVLDQD